MTTSYSASLLEAWNLNLSAYSISISSGEVRIRPAPLPYALWPHLQRVSRWGGQSAFERSQQALLR